MHRVAGLWRAYYGALERSERVMESFPWKISRGRGIIKRTANLPRERGRFLAEGDGAPLNNRHGNARPRILPRVFLRFSLARVSLATTIVQFALNSREAQPERSSFALIVVPSGLRGESARGNEDYRGNWRTSWQRTLRPCRLT